MGDQEPAPEIIAALESALVEAVKEGVKRSPENLARLLYLAGLERLPEALPNNEETRERWKKRCDDIAAQIYAGALEE